MQSNKQKAPPRRGFSVFCFLLFEQRHSYPFSGCKEKREPVACCNSTVAHTRHLKARILFVNILEKVFSSVGGQFHCRRRPSSAPLRSSPPEISLPCAVRAGRLAR